MCSKYPPLVVTCSTKERTGAEGEVGGGPGRGQPAVALHAVQLSGECEPAQSNLALYSPARPLHFSPPALGSGKQQSKNIL